jgi:hypothetical protein
LIDRNVDQNFVLYEEAAIVRGRNAQRHAEREKMGLRLGVN